MSVIVLKERNEGSCDRYGLLGAHIHEVDLLGRSVNSLSHVAAGNVVADDVSVGVNLGGCLGDVVLRIALVNRGKVLDAVGYHTVLHYAVRGLEEAVVVAARIGCKGVDKSDVRSFRGLNRAESSVMGRMHIADLESGALTGKSAGAECGDAALVGNLGKRVVLIHELGELAGAEELLDGSRNRLRVHEVLGLELIIVAEGKAVADSLYDARESGPEAVLRHLADRADAPVAEVVDIIGGVAAVSDLDELAEHADEILFGQDARGAEILARIETAVELHAAYCREIIAIRIHEQGLEELLVILDIVVGSLARAHHGVDFLKRALPVEGLVLLEGVSEICAAVDAVGEENVDLGNAMLTEGIDYVPGELGICGASFDQLSGLRITYICIETLVLKAVACIRILVILLCLGVSCCQGDVDEVTLPCLVESLHDLLRIVGSQRVVLLDNGLAVNSDIEVKLQVAEVINADLELGGIRIIGEPDLLGLEEQLQDLLVAVAESMEKNCREELAAPVDTYIEQVLDVKLKVEP